MNKEWIENKEAEQRRKIATMKQAIFDQINGCELFTDDQKSELCKHVETYEKEPACRATFELALNNMMDYGRTVQMDVLDYWKWSQHFIDSTGIEDYIMALRYQGYHYLLDSEPVEFDGDVIITDPCYVVKKRDETNRPKWNDYMQFRDYRGMSEEEKRAVGFYEDYERLSNAQNKWEEEHPRDWEICECGYEMEALGLKTVMSRNTIYGDWSCTTYNSDTKEEIGEFCADSGMVAVFDLNEVLAYNPEYDDHVEKNWCVTVIKNFKGTVQFVVERNESKYGEEFDVKVVGHGVNKVTGELINFITSQTGL